MVHSDTVLKGLQQTSQTQRGLTPVHGSRGSRSQKVLHHFGPLTKIPHLGRNSEWSKLSLWVIKKKKVERRQAKVLMMSPAEP